MTDRARAKLVLTIRRAANRYPFHAAILERFEIRADPTVETMGVQATSRGVLLLYADSFVQELSDGELLGVLLHEVHHVLFKHILTATDDYADAWARVVAEEVTVNEFVAEPLPPGVILLREFPDLPPMESTQQRYARLRHHQARFPMAAAGSLIDPAAAPVKGTIDNHDVWARGAETADAAEARAGAVQDLVDDAALAVGMEQVPGEFHELLGLEAPGRGELRWPDLLRRYTGRLAERQPRLDRPSRRFPELVGLLPGVARRQGRPKIMAVIDTSGSVTPELLEQISAELARLGRDFAVTVVECDDTIHAVYPYRPLTTVRGRGGTDLRPPLDRLFLRAQRPDLVVYFTDGFGPAPSRAPKVPVIWCLVPGGAAPARWGRVIHMHDAPARSQN